MERDLDSAREILLQLGDVPYEDAGQLYEPNIEGQSAAKIWYHVKLLYEAGLVSADDLSSKGSPMWLPTELTWDGHEFLEAAQNEKAWNKAKTFVAQKGGGLVFATIQKLLVQAVTKEVFDQLPI